MAHPFTARIEALLASEEPLDPSVVVDLARQIRQDPPRRDDDGIELMEAVEVLIARSRGQLTELESALRKTTQGRRALKGYGSLKAIRKSQRANRVG